MAMGRWAVVCALLGGAGTAQAQVPSSAPDDSPALGQPAVPPEVFVDLARLEVLLASHSAEARTARLTVGSVFVATGLAAVPVGIVAQTSWHQDYGIGMWVSGTVLLLAGTAALVLESPLEALQRDFQATAATLSPAERLAYGTRALASVAASAHSSRVVSSVVGYGLTALSLGIAIGEFASASNNTGSNRSDLQAAGATYLVLTALFAGASTVQLLLPSPAETAYASYQARQTPAPQALHLSGGVLPVRGGAMVGLGGAF